MCIRVLYKKSALNSLCASKLLVINKIEKSNYSKKIPKKFPNS